MFLQRYICAEEIQKLLAVSKNSKNLHDIILTSFNTGLRLSEALNLKWPDVHLDSLYLMVKGKGNRARKIPMNTRLMEMLEKRRSLPSIKNKARQSPSYVFTVPGTVRPYTPAGFRSMFARATRRAGIKCRFQDLRHTFATSLIRGGVDLITVKELLGQ